MKIKRLTEYTQEEIRTAVHASFMRCGYLSATEVWYELHRGENLPEPYPLSDLENTEIRHIARDMNKLYIGEPNDTHSTDTDRQT